MYTDFILNRQGFGDVGESLAECRFEPGLMRPFRDTQNGGKPSVIINTGNWRIDPKTKERVPQYGKFLVKDLMEEGIFSPVFNATSLRKEEWIRTDEAVLRAARKRLKAWSDLAASSSYGGFNGMATSLLEHETMSDPGYASVDMEGVTEGKTDNPLYQLEGIPLPITHSSFWFTQRRLMESRNKGMPLDLTMAEACGRRVAESIEKTLIGTQTGMTYGGGSATPTYGRASTVFGYTNFPSRLTYTSVPTPTGSNAGAILSAVLHMRDLLYANNMYGPFMIYTSDDWDGYLDNDYILSGGNVATSTLRKRLKEIDDVVDVRRLDYLTAATNPFTLIMVCMDPEVARAVNGMDLTTIQWQSGDGMRVYFKVMAIKVPQLRADYTGKCGICVGTTS